MRFARIAPIVLAVLPLLSACVGIAEFTPVGFEKFNGRKAIFIKATDPGGVPADIHKRFVDRLEKELGASPHIGKLMTREEVARATSGKRELWQQYRILSDTFSIVGVGDQEISTRLNAELGGELLIMTQIFFEPCDQCPDGSLFGVIGAIIEAETGILLYRLHLSQRGPIDPVAEIPQLAEDYATELLDAINAAIRPKWHKLRFRQIAALGKS